MKKIFLKPDISTFFIISLILHIIVLSFITFGSLKSKKPVSSEAISLLDINLSRIETKEIKVINKEVSQNNSIENSEEIVISQNAGSGYLSVFEVTTLPKFIIKVKPRYPWIAEKAGIEGTVILEVDIDETGKVVDARVIKEAGFGFDEAAIEAIKKCRFSPALRYGKPVPIRVRLPIRFELE